MNIKFIALAVLIPLVTGCNKTPADADVKNSIAKVFEQCPIVEVTNFEKKNGFTDEQSGHYITSVQYVLRVTPPNGNDLLLNEYAKIESNSYKLADEWRTLEKEIYNHQEKLNETYEKIHEINNRHTKELEVVYPDVASHDVIKGLMDQEYRLKYENAKKLFDAELKERLSSDPIYSKTIAERDDLENMVRLKQEESDRINHESSIASQNMRNYFQQMMHAYRTSCKSSYVPQEIYQKISFAKNPHALHEEFSITYNAEFNLIKTDNGWVIKEFYDL